MIDLLYTFFFWPTVLVLLVLALVVAVRCPAHRLRPRRWNFERWPSKERDGLFNPGYDEMLFSNPRWPMGGK